MRHAWIVGFLTIAVLSNPAIRNAAGTWQEHTIRQLNGQSLRIPLRAEFQYITGAKPELVITPYLVYLPEKDRLLMLVNRDRPHEAALMHSDDHGAFSSRYRACPLETQPEAWQWGRFDLASTIRFAVAQCLGPAIFGFRPEIAARTTSNDYRSILRDSRFSIT